MPTNREDTLTASYISPAAQKREDREVAKEQRDTETAERGSIIIGILDKAKVDTKIAFWALILTLLGLFSGIVYGVCAFNTKLEQHTETLNVLVPEEKETHDTVIRMNQKMNDWMAGPFQPITPPPKQR